MGTHASNTAVARVRKLFAGRRKKLTRSEAEHWRDELTALCGSQYGIDLHPLQSDPAVAPPKRVVNQVEGSSKSDPNTFFGTGYRETVRYLSELADHGFSVARMERMLDLGVGTGRVLLHFLPFAIEHYGCDVNAAAYEWTQNALGSHAKLSLTGLDPPLPYRDGFFDLVIATSVFTHTPYAAQPGWIAELRRIVKAGGCAIVTVHDFSKFPPESRDRGWHERGTERGLHMNTYLTEEKLRELWSSAFDVLEIRAYSPGQAHVIARRL